MGNVVEVKVNKMAVIDQMFYPILLLRIMNLICVYVRIFYLPKVN